MVEMKDLLAQTPHGDNAVLRIPSPMRWFTARSYRIRTCARSITIFLRARGYVNDDDLQRGIARNSQFVDPQSSGGPAGSNANG